MIDKVLYINLEHRKDRKESVEKELKKIGFSEDKIERIDAVKTNPGWIGCGMSHLKALDNAIKNNYDTVMIVEDDIIFNKNIDSDKFTNLVQNLYKDFSDFDICSLTCSIYQKKVIKLNSYLSKAINVKTVTGIIVRKKFYQTLYDKFSECVEKLQKREPYCHWAIDVKWADLQGQNSKFYIFDPVIAKQSSGYSDIVKKDIAYKF